MDEIKDTKNLIYIAQERAFAPGCSSGWKKIIQPKSIKNGRLVGLIVSDKLMKAINKEMEK